MQQRKLELMRRIERQYVRERVGELGLQSAEAALIHLLDLEGRMRQEDIVLCSGLDKGSVARTLARLEERGMVARAVSDRCRREKLVSLTPAGEEAARQVQQVLYDWRSITYRGFTPEEREQCDAFLLRAAENAAEFKRGECADG